ncbi:MAG: hypothetical protein AAFY27_07650 [Pseudomonadota bacterium]
MVFAYGMVRVVASLCALIVGAAGWPIYFMVPIIAVHATGSFFYSAALFGEVQDRLSREQADAAAIERHALFYRPIFLRELAYAFIKCGIAYFIGFWIAQFGAAPPPPVG